MTMYKVSPSVQPRNQTLSTCCWLTCLEMLYEWHDAKYGSGKDPNTILETMDQSPDLFPYEMQSSGIDASECKNTARILGLRWSGATKTLDANTLASMIKSRGPLWIAGKFSHAFHHVIVVTACDPANGRIKIVNPYKNYSLQETPQTISWLEDRGFPWTACDASIMYW